MSDGWRTRTCNTSAGAPVWKDPAILRGVSATLHNSRVVNAEDVHVIPAAGAADRIGIAVVRLMLPNDQPRRLMGKWALADAFSVAPGAILAAGGIVQGQGENDGKILLVRRRRYAGEMGLPKGKVKWHEDVAAAALREVREETGYNLEIVEYPGRTNADNGDVITGTNWPNQAEHSKSILTRDILRSLRTHSADSRGFAFLQRIAHSSTKLEDSKPVLQSLVRTTISTKQCHLPLPISILNCSGQASISASDGF